MGTIVFVDGLTHSDHDLTVAIPGAVESIRPRLIKALETLGYSVVSEQPLHAQRRRQGSARCYSSVNALDYSMTVTVSLKQINDVSALVTFSYRLKSYIHLTEGDRETLAREAEAIAAQRLSAWRSRPALPVELRLPMNLTFADAAEPLL